MIDFNSICPSVLLVLNIIFLNKPVLVFSCSETSLVTIHPNNGHYTSLDPNQALQGHVILTSQTRNSFMCAGKCQQNEDCKSVNYSPILKTCELNGKHHLTHPTDLVRRRGFRYYYYNWSKFSGCSFTTAADRCYKFLFPRLADGTTRIEFSVKTASDALVGITTENRLTEPLYEIDFGGNKGQSVFIRRGKESNNKVSLNIGHLVDSSEYRRFWITFDNGHIQVGRYQESEPLAQWQDPDPISVHYVSFGSWYNANGEWILHTFCDAPWLWQPSATLFNNSP